MANLIVHFSIALLAFIFPDKFYFWPLFLGSVFSDFEYIYITVYNLFKTKSIKKTSRKILDTGIFHSLLGVIIICLPLCYLLSLFIVEYYIPDYNYKIVFGSVLLGLISHLILDIPAHPRLMLFWPVKVYKRNPYLIKRRFSKLEKMYRRSSVSKIEEYLDEYLPSFIWLVLSFLITVILILFVIFKKIY